MNTFHASTMTSHPQWFAQQEIEISRAHSQLEQVAMALQQLGAQAQQAATIYQQITARNEQATMVYKQRLTAYQQLVWQYQQQTLIKQTLRRQHEEQIKQEAEEFDRLMREADELREKELVESFEEERAEQCFEAQPVVDKLEVVVQQRFDKHTEAHKSRAQRRRSDRSARRANKDAGNYIEEYFRQTQQAAADGTLVCGEEVSLEERKSQAKPAHIVRAEKKYRDSKKIQRSKWRRDFSSGWRQNQTFNTFAEVAAAYADKW
jgi:hypothetical protein